MKAFLFEVVRLVNLFQSSSVFMLNIFDLLFERLKLLMKVALVVKAFDFTSLRTLLYFQLGSPDLAFNLFLHFCIKL